MAGRGEDSHVSPDGRALAGNAAERSERRGFWSPSESHEDGRSGGAEAHGANRSLAVDRRSRSPWGPAGRGAARGIEVGRSAPGPGPVDAAGGQPRTEQGSLSRLRDVARRHWSTSAREVRHSGRSLGSVSPPWMLLFRAGACRVRSGPAALVPCGMSESLACLFLRFYDGRPASPPLASTRQEDSRPPPPRGGFPFLPAAPALPGSRSWRARSIATLFCCAKRRLIDPGSVRRGGSSQPLSSGEADPGRCGRVSQRGLLLTWTCGRLFRGSNRCDAG